MTVAWVYVYGVGVLVYVMCICMRSIHPYTYPYYSVYSFFLGETPLVSLPRGNGVKLSILEEREMKLQRSKKAAVADEEDDE
ncbi:hypothetical protein EON63_03485 [archaeon]|nr:MAG: hypothetical protein EON63_03485 [archaeon]